MNVINPPVLKITNSPKNEEQNEASSQRRFKSVHFINRESMLAANGDKKSVFTKKNTVEIDSLQDNHHFNKMSPLLDVKLNEGEERSNRPSILSFYDNSPKNKKKSFSVPGIPGKPRSSVYNRYKKKQSLKLSNEEDFKVRNMCLI